jgi:uncharacterized membrane protein YdfJ with MMPL/SSD domain
LGRAPGAPRERRPWLYFVPCLALLAALAAPALRMNSWSVGVTDLPPEIEARQGFEELERNFARGWMGPVVLLLESAGSGGLWQERSRQAVLEINARLREDKRVAQVQGYGSALEALGAATGGMRSASARSHAALTDVINASGTVAVINVIPRFPPESPEMMAWVRDLRARGWPEAAAAGVTVKVGGASALIHDFDNEMFGSLWRVPSVLAVSFARSSSSSARS